MEHAILIKYAEIHLKGLNRPFFEKKLVTNIRHALGEIPGEIVRDHTRQKKLSAFFQRRAGNRSLSLWRPACSRRTVSCAS